MAKDKLNIYAPQYGINKMQHACTNAKNKNTNRLSATKVWLHRRACADVIRLSLGGKNEIKLPGISSFDHKMLILKETERDVSDCIENGMIRINEHESKLYGEVVFCLPVETIFRQDGIDYRNFFIDSKMSVMLKKTIPHMNYHREWSTVENSMYSVNSAEATSIDIAPNIIQLGKLPSDLHCKRVTRERVIETSESTFTIYLPMKVKMWLDLYTIFDNTRIKTPQFGKWNSIQTTGNNQKYVLHVLFEERTATRLAHSIRVQKEKLFPKEWSGTDEFKVTCCRKLCQDCIHSLYVSIAPALATLRSTCVDLVLGMMLVSTNVFWHRDKVNELIYTIKYMDKMIQLKNEDKLEEFTYGTVMTLSHDKLHAITVCQNMHNDLKKIILSEIITDVTNDIMHGGHRCTYDMNSLHECINVYSDIEDIKKEVFHRIGDLEIGKSLDLPSDNKFKRMLYLLQSECGIYSRTNSDERVYNLRNIIQVDAANMPKKILKMLLRCFISECRTSQTFKRQLIHPDDVQHHDLVFDFLDNFRQQINGQVLEMIQVQQDTLLRQNEEMLNKMEVFVSVKKIRVQ